MRRHVLMVVAAVVLAGCTQLGTTPAQEKPDVIQVDGPTCRIGGTACAGTTVTKFGGPATVRMTIGNFGEAPVTVDVGKQGRGILVSKCNNRLASLEAGSGGFAARREGPARFDDTRQGWTPEKWSAVTLKKDERLTLEWTLEIVPGDGDVSRLGYSCPLEFEAQFAQQLRTRRQVQIKTGADVRDVTELDTETTSERPVRLRIDAPESFLAAEGKAMSVNAFLENVGGGEITSVSSIQPVENSFVSRHTENECTPPDKDLRLFGEGPREGQSYRKTCVVTPRAPVSGSTVEWLAFTATYSYRLPLATKTIEIQPSGAG